MEPTVFIRILRRELPAAIDHEDALAFAFMDAGQLNPGHVLVATCVRGVDDRVAFAVGHPAPPIGVCE